MSSSEISSIVFASAFGGSVFAMVVKRFLPEHHLSPDSKEIVKIGMGLVASMSALVISLLIATAKGTYDAQSSAVTELSANFILLDRVLIRYGPEASEPRDLLKKVVKGTIDRTWPQDQGQAADLTPSGDTKAVGEVIYDKIGELAPKTEAQRELRTRAIGIIAEITQARMRIYSRQESGLPRPLLIVLVFWLTILFAGYGLLAPVNSTVLVVLLICAMSVGGAVFLMEELTTPFSGIMRVSSVPMQNALSIVSQ